MSKREREGVINMDCYKRLYGNVIVRAIKDAFKFNGKSMTSKYEQREAYEWLYGEKEEDNQDFLDICDSCGIDAIHLKKLLIELKDNEFEQHKLKINMNSLMFEDIYCEQRKKVTRKQISCRKDLTDRILRAISGINN